MCLSALLIFIFAVAPQSEDSGLLDRIIESHQRMENAYAMMQVSGKVSVSAWNETWLKEPWLTTLTYKCVPGTVHLDTVGIDLLAGVGPSGVPSVGQISRLYHSGGAVETLDVEKKLVKYKNIASRDPRVMYNPVAPSEYVWALSGALRSKVLRVRPARIVDVTGSMGGRTVTVEAPYADGPGSFHVYSFEFVESWGWLARRASTRIDARGLSQEVLSVVILGVHHTRLGAFPAEGLLVYWGAATGTQRERVPLQKISIQFDLPQVTGVLLPSHLDNNTSKVAGDPIFAETAFVAGLGVGARESALSDLLNSSVRTEGWVVGPRAGVPRAWFAGLDKSVVFLIFAGIITAWAILRHRVRSAIVAGSVVIITQIAASARFGSEASDQPFGTVIIDTAETLRSVYLCGVDALFATIRSAGKAEPYPDLVRLVRPGKEGTDLERLSIVATALGYKVAQINPRTWSCPPLPLILHVDGGHFVAVIGARGDEDVLVLDSARGIVTVPWPEIRSHSSPVALSILR